MTWRTFGVSCVLVAGTGITITAFMAATILGFVMLGIFGAICMLLQEYVQLGVRSDRTS